MMSVVEKRQVPKQIPKHATDDDTPSYYDHVDFRTITGVLGCVLFL